MYLILTVCGGQLTVGPGGSGYIFSPQYGIANYSNNLNCEWTLGNSAITNSSLYLTFEDGFDLESSSTCSFDYLQLFEGTVFLSRNFYFCYMSKYVINLELCCNHEIIKSFPSLPILLREY